LAPFSLLFFSLLFFSLLFFSLLFFSLLFSLFLPLSLLFRFFIEKKREGPRILMDSGPPESFEA
jgi:hypothetical protein